MDITSDWLDAKIQQARSEEANHLANANACNGYATAFQEIKARIQAEDPPDEPTSD